MFAGSENVCKPDRWGTTELEIIFMAEACDPEGSYVRRKFRFKDWKTMVLLIMPGKRTLSITLSIHLDGKISLKSQLEELVSVIKVKYPI